MFKCAQSAKLDNIYNLDVSINNLRFKICTKVTSYFGLF